MFQMPGTRSKAGGKSFPTGTVLPFYNTNAPTGWTKLTSQNDKALRVVSGSGGVSGGTNPFSTVMAQTVVGSTSLSTAQLAAHSHSVYYDYTQSGTLYGAQLGTTQSSSSQTSTQGSGSSHNHTITMAIQYIDVILASKN